MNARTTLEAAIERGKAVLTDCNFIAWRNEDNYGLGGSHKAAFSYAIEQGFDYLVVLHGDDQANIHDLLPQLEAGAHLQVDCLLGARFMPGSQLKGYSWFRTFGNRVYNALFSLVARRVIYDLGSGLNLYRIETFREFYFKTFPDDLTFNYAPSELLLQAKSTFLSYFLARRRSTLKCETVPSSIQGAWTTCRICFEARSFYKQRSACAGF